MKTRNLKVNTTTLTTIETKGYYRAYFLIKKAGGMDVLYFGATDCPNLNVHGCMSCNPV